MIPILSLWMPILASAVFVFIMSSILHMVLKYHQADYRKLPDEEAVLEALYAASPAPGLYHFPHCATPKEMGEPDMVEKLNRGPVGFITVIPSGPMNMGKYLGQWFVFTVLVGVFIAYIAGRTHAPGTAYLSIFRFTGTVAFMTYGVGALVDSIWRGAPWSNTARTVADGLVYALVTAGAFGWLWP